MTGRSTCSLIRSLPDLAKADSHTLITCILLSLSPVLRAPPLSKREARMCFLPSLYRVCCLPWSPLCSAGLPSCICWEDWPRHPLLQAALHGPPGSLCHLHATITAQASPAQPQTKGLAPQKWQDGIRAQCMLPRYAAIWKRTEQLSRIVCCRLLTKQEGQHCIIRLVTQPKKKFCSPSTPKLTALAALTGRKGSRMAKYTTARLLTQVMKIMGTV